MTQKIRIGIVGAGQNTRKMHIPKFQEIEGVEIVGVVNRLAATSRAVAEQFGIPQIYPNWRELVASPEIDAVVIGTWPYLHAPVTLHALEHGKHVLTEARMCMNYDEAWEMYQAHLEHPELVAQVVPAPYTLEVDQTIQDILAQKELGEILAVRIDSFGGFPPEKLALHWRNLREYSGLNIMAMGIHYETVARWLGHVKWVQAHAKIFQPNLMSPEGRTVPVYIPDYLSVQGEFAGGIAFSMNLATNLGVGHANGIYIFGTKGTVFFDLSQLKLFQATQEVPQFKPVEISETRHRGWQVEADFIDSIRHGTPVGLTSFLEGLRYMAFTEAVSRSVAGNSRVTVPLAGESF